MRLIARLPLLAATVLLAAAPGACGASDEETAASPAATSPAGASPTTAASPDSEAERAGAATEPTSANRYQSLPRPPASAQPQPTTPGRTFRVSAHVTGLDQPLWVGAAPGDASGLWIAEQGGRLLRKGAGKPQLMLSIAGRTEANGEQGLLGVAFHPGFAKNRLVVLHSTNRAGDTRVELWRMGTTAGRSKLMRTLLKVKQPFPNHNGGEVAFHGTTLYLGLGDGGSGDDPQGNGQKLSTKLGKLLSARVTGTGPVSWKTAGYGLRNPWRFFIDDSSDEIWIADVGENAVEEINRVKLGGAAPNYGWSVFEGGLRDEAGGNQQLLGSGELIWPAISYSHDDGGCSVTGGEIYRGSAIPALKGRYVYGDFCNGALWSVEPAANLGVGPIRAEAASVPQVSSFGSDAKGELYATSLAGTVYKLRAN